MAKRVLVAYVSKYGATKEIAEKVAEVLRRSGLNVDVSAASGNAKEAAGYDAVVFGSGVYFGSWPKRAIGFLQAWDKVANPPPVWLFFSGPTGEGDPKAQTMDGQAVPKRQRPVIERIKPRDMAFFHGKVDPAKLNFLESWAIRAVKAPSGDFRNWNAIASWADAIAKALGKRA
jgi:menaquinone-dependent protoporphyrinogen oxidase